MPASMNRRALRGIMFSHSRLTAPCTWQRKPSSAYLSARTMPDLASLSEASTSWVLFPIEETIPMPVTTTRLIEVPFPASSRALRRCTVAARLQCSPALSGRYGLFSRFEQANAQIRGCVDYLAIGFHCAIGDGELQLAQDHPLQVDHVLHRLGRGHDHAREFNFADAERASSARCTEPTQEEARQLPERI